MRCLKLYPLFAGVKPASHCILSSTHPIDDCCLLRRKAHFCCGGPSSKTWYRRSAPNHSHALDLLHDFLYSIFAVMTKKSKGHMAINKSTSRVAAGGQGLARAHLTAASVLALDATDIASAGSPARHREEEGTPNTCRQQAVAPEKEQLPAHDREPALPSSGRSNEQTLPNVLRVPLHQWPVDIACPRTLPMEPQILFAVVRAGRRSCHRVLPTSSAQRMCRLGQRCSVMRLGGRLMVGISPAASPPGQPCSNTCIHIFVCACASSD